MNFYTFKQVLKYETIRRRSQFNEEENEAGLKYEVDLNDKTNDVTHTREFTTK